MRILVLSNLYPPHYIGGYELGCRDVVDGLRARGHAVTVLTSDYGTTPDAPGVEAHVERHLRTDLTSRPSPLLVCAQGVARWMARVPGLRLAAFVFGRIIDLPGTVAREVHNQRIFATQVARHRPDVVYVWNPAAVSLSLVWQARALGYPVSFFVSDDWPTTARTDRAARLARMPLVGHIYRRALRRAGGDGAVVPDGRLRLTHAQFCSAFLQRLVEGVGYPHADSRVIHWGVRVAEFPWTMHRDASAGRWLFVGQVVPIKGVHTAITALAFVRQTALGAHCTLTIAGGSVAPEYLAQLKARVANDPVLQGAVRFLGKVPRADLAELYASHDVLIFSSEWQEPFSIAVLEGLASGIPLVATPTGGTPEVLRERETALLFPAGDAATCAAQVLHLMEHPALAGTLSVTGRHVVETHFTLEMMLQRIEEALVTVSEDDGSGHP